jgi:hypothetical protein
VDFYKILEVASITVVMKWAPKEGSKKGNCGNPNLDFFCSRPQIGTKIGSLKFSNK